MHAPNKLSEAGVGSCLSAPPTPPPAPPGVPRCVPPLIARWLLHVLCALYPCRVCMRSFFRYKMAPVSYITLIISALSLLLPRKGADAFVHPRPALLRSRQQQQSIMVMSATRRAFLSDQLVGAVGAGVLGLGVATERATAYEVSGSEVREHGAVCLSAGVCVCLFCWARDKRCLC